jgi:hypothetical protein
MRKSMWGRFDSNLFRIVTRVSLVLLGIVVAVMLFNLLSTLQVLHGVLPVVGFFAAAGALSGAHVAKRRRVER